MEDIGNPVSIFTITADLQHISIMWNIISFVEYAKEIMSCINKIKNFLLKCIVRILIKHKNIIFIICNKGEKIKIMKIHTIVYCINLIYIYILF